MMFINSIFLPKPVKDQTISEGIAGRIGNFSHLFSNVFRIIKDDQPGTIPFQLMELPEESTAETQSQLLNVSLLSDCKIVQDNQNIASIVSAFLTKMNPETSNEITTNIENTKINEKTSKYFSLNKNELIGEIKNIIDSLKKGNSKKIENIEISLIANGQSIQINPLTANITELENWVGDQIKLNNDFEILVKSGSQKLAVEVEPLKTETEKSATPIQIISETDHTEIKIDTNSTVTKNIINNDSKIKSLPDTQSQFEKPLEGLKATIDETSQQSEKPENTSTQKQIVSEVAGNNKTDVYPGIKLSSDLFVAVDPQTKVKSPLISELRTTDKSQLNNNLKAIQINNAEVVEKNITTSNLKIEKPIDLKLYNSNESKTGIENPIEKSLSKNNITIVNDNNSVKQPNTELKTNSFSLKINHDKSDTVIKKDDDLHTHSEVNVKELNKSETKIKVSSNQKFTSITTNNNDIKDKVVLNDLLEKTNVKEIKINVHNSIKSIINAEQKTQNEVKSAVTTEKINNVQKQSPTLDNESTKIFLSTPEKLKTVNKNFSSENIKSGKVIPNAVEDDLLIIKPEKTDQVFDTVKATNTPKIKVQQELFVESGLSEIEESISPKSSTLQPTSFDSGSIKQNIAVRTDTKIPSEKIDLTHNDNTDIEVPKIKLEENTFSTTRKIIPPEPKNELSSETIKVIVQNDDAVEKNKTDNIGEVKELTKINIKEKEPDTIKKSLTVESKTEKQGNEIELKIKTNDVSRRGNINYKTVKDNSSIKSNPDELSKINTKTFSKSELNPADTSEKVFSIKDKSIIENLRSSLKEMQSEQVKQEGLTKNQIPVENKNTKVDFIQRRVYSQIPPLEVIADEAKIEKLKNVILSFESDSAENIKTNTEPTKSVQNQVEQNPKNEKQIWVKVSLEKTDNDVKSDVRKSAQLPNKITIDTNNNGMKNNSEQNDFNEKNQQDYSKSKPHNVAAETTPSIEVKTVVQNQNSPTLQDLNANLKPEIKIEHMPFKSSLHSEETTHGLHNAEMIEKIKVISAGEMIREVSKIFESGEKQSIVLRLVPKELGSVKVMLDTIDNVLTAKVEVENETVGQIVRNNVDQLKQNLLQSGISLSTINISYHNSDQKQHGYNNHKRKNSVYEQNIETEDIDETILSKKMGYNTYEYLA
jgi:hypothetical protein